MPSPGWYNDPTNDQLVRYWDGVRWTKHESKRPKPVVAPLAPPARSARPASVSASGGLAVLTALSPRTILLLALAAVTLLVLVIGAIGAAASSANLGGAHFAAVDTATSTPTPVAKAAEPKPKVKVTYTEVSETSPVPFNRVAVDDGNRDAGTSEITTPGADGVSTKVYRVKLEDGVEVSRALTSDSVTTAPIDEVTTNGTYVAPPPPPVQQAEPAPVDAGGGCDSNYEGQCVPIDSDVDCAGGSGNGPSYVSGPVYVVGSDVYDLDRDGDGIACDK
jgi:hypothetical protein